MSARIYTVPSGVAFLNALARGLLHRHPSTDDPFALAKISIFLPTRRAVRGLENAFLEAQSVRGLHALLLPKMRALGDADEEELLLSEGDEGNIDIPPAVPALHRRLRLAELLRRGTEMSFGEALRWSESLARFLDEATIEEVDLRRLEGVIPETLAAHYQSSRELIAILTDHWKAILEEDGYIESAERRARLMAGGAESWKRSPERPVYIAGSTGSIPATARLMAAATALENGALVLPGLDRILDDESWNEIDETHPQFGLKQLLARLGVPRNQVLDWPYSEQLPRVAQARMRLMTEILRPAPTTDSWAKSLADIAVVDALNGLQLHVARDQTQEARLIALAMRQVLETPAKTAALVTPDRHLARRVASELMRWGIEVNESAGVPLAQASAVTLLRLLADAASEDSAPVALLALLKHPLASLGDDPSGYTRARASLERHALRGPRPAPGINGIRARLDEKRNDYAEHKASEEELVRLTAEIQAAYWLVDAIEAAMRPLVLLKIQSRASAENWAEAVTDCAERFAGTKMWSGEEGEAAANLLREILAHASGAFTLAEFIQLFSASCEDRVVRPRSGIHPRLFIWGPLEARLQSADLVILSGLNEGLWPAHAEIDPWASRPMRKAVELSVPERRIGLAAHDFLELACAPTVLLTASKKVAGAPALLSRWLMRLQNLLSSTGLIRHLESEPLGLWASALDAPRHFTPVQPPEPKPPLALRPRRFRVTDIGPLRRDPYAIYARRILGLKPLDPVDADLTPRLRGSVFHEIYESFARAFPDELPPAAALEIVVIGEAKLAQLALDLEQKEMWRARIRRAARSVIEWEIEERRRARILDVEALGEIELPAPAGPIKLTGRIDRIDVDRISGLATIIDYKTGFAATKKQVEAMLDPQLPLCALLLREGAIASVEKRQSDRLVYLKIGGTSEKVEALNLDKNVDALLSETKAGLVELLASYDQESTPYYSRAIVQSSRDIGDYDLLARSAEWGIEGGGEE